MYKCYATGTGGGPAKTLDTSPSEDDLLEFLTPEASGMDDIPEAGVISNSFCPDNNSLSDSLTSQMNENFVSQSPNFTSNLTIRKPLMPQDQQNRQINKELLSQRKTLQNLQTFKSTKYSKKLQDATSFRQINVEEDPCHSDIINVDADFISSNELKGNVRDSLTSQMKENFISQSPNFTSNSTIRKPLMPQNQQSGQTTKELLSKHKTLQNLQTFKSTKYSQRLQDTTSFRQINVEENSCHSDIINVDADFISSNELKENVKDTQKNRKCSNDENTSNKKIKQDVKHLLKQYTCDNFNNNEQMLQIKQEKLAIAKEDLEFKKKHTKRIPNYLHY
ncbi:uncharacterized protein LOC118644147 [Monomorium pharaonis]|uniref:uncharacterized protein LOC118644147 n=1 Tax=Monomorium pharaonis TaxID=307658 RepID=UPI001746311B|nr:uncharacterized protein LOC118644147 [Monomorium pharaonis]